MNKKSTDFLIQSVLSLFMPIICLLIVVSNSYHIGSLDKRLEKIIKTQQALEFVQDQQNSHLYKIMDTEVRILHYSMPHKEQIAGCPECREEDVTDPGPKVPEGVPPHLPKENSKK